MNTKYIDYQLNFITNAQLHGRDKSWCIGYVQALYNTGQITTDELETLTQTITTLYA